MSFWKTFGALVGLAAICSESRAVSHDFSVRDSIEMEVFSDPSQADPFAVAKRSPDQRHFAIVTTKGRVETDDVESTLWVFDAAAVTAFLKGGNAKAPAPRRVARLHAVPVRIYTGNNAPIISDLRWSADSSSIYFLAQDSSGDRRLYRAPLDAESPFPLTPEDLDVTDFVVGNGVLVYTAASTEADKARIESRVAGDWINSDARAVTGKSLTDILFPEFIRSRYRFVELHVIHEDGGRTVDTLLPGAAVLASPGNVLSLSPDSQYVVQLLPVKSIPSAWERYETPPQLSRKRFQIRRDNPQLTSDFNQFSLKRYTLTHLPTGRATVLIDAPQDIPLAYSDDNSAVWSSDGTRVMLTGVFFPITDEARADSSEPLRPCIAAVVDIGSRDAECVLFHGSKLAAELNDAGLTNAVFEGKGDEVTLRFERYSRVTTLRFQRGPEGWALASRATTEGPVGPPGGDSAAGVSLWVRQTLNDPPALWAISTPQGIAKAVWNPNPTLGSQIRYGDASVFRWKDEDGVDWIGGLIKPVEYRPGTRYPLVIQAHGFHREDEFPTHGAYTTASAARALASAGIMVLQMRDSHEHVLTPQEASQHVNAFTSAIRKLAHAGLVDSARVGIVGFSRTSWYVERALIDAPSAFAAATLADGVDESYMQYHLFADELLSEPEQIYGTRPFGAGARKWTEMAPGFLLDRISVPVRIEAITPLSILGEWEIYSSLRRQGKPVDLIYFPYGQHILQRPLERVASEQGSVDWFDFWLNGHEDADPTKAPQYRRWERLCDLQAAADPARRPACVTTQH